MGAPESGLELESKVQRPKSERMLTPRLPRVSGEELEELRTKETSS
jgi:hypothetical protein